MGCKCCRWPVNACKMARMVRLLPLSFTALVLFLTVHSFYNDALITGTLLLILFFPVLDFPKRKPLKLPPGPSGVPVLGYLPFLGENPHQEMAKLAHKYGPLVHIQLGSFPGFVVANARLAKEVLMTQDQVFFGSFVTWAEHFTYSNLEDSSIRFTRRLVAAELMAPKRKEFFKAIQSEEMDAMVQELQSKVKDGKHVVDLHLAIGAMAMNITTRMVMKKRYYYTKDVSSETVEKEASQFQKLLVTRARRPFLQDVVPPLMSLISSSNNRAMAKVTKHTDAIMDTILREHRQRPNALESSQDIMDMLTQSVGEDGKPLDDNAIKAVTMEMLVAGTESTARATEWVLAELIRHPEIQAEVQSELDAVIGRTRVAQECDIPNLQYLQAVVRETGRLHPVVPLLRAPSNPEPTELDGYHVPAHSLVFVNLWAMGRDPALWDRPERFDPARFLAQAGEGRSVDEMGMQVVVSVAVARLVHGFGWWAKDMDVGERFGWSLQMRAPLCRVCCEARLPA